MQRRAIGVRAVWFREDCHHDLAAALLHTLTRPAPQQQAGYLAT